ncbi:MULTISPECIES: Fe2+-enterobactin ABC transporter substrate-binding protein [Erwiniaceae]|uniref:Fe2+-enterobactin ABC transporter substrate-binding protein n=1 Tax=Pantoea coffeiphila TaxID=1465635 RepID=A0A2S9I9Y7_9GAMM|nr:MULTISPECIES: Fe2+-enterobactin ABC transporter substrate-binding protein [Erwiniaceae]MCW1875822.1 Fe2+-enterobactin ABC transporter substrate-binding protein [Erwinia sp. INIA01]PRD14612.1 Fe2+-enterobactin ABC transporter substrate-binding protein [Pantoea coffeiphila]
MKKIKLNLRYLLSLVLLITAFSSQAEGEKGWPRQFHNADGTTTTIPAKPKRILSTSVTVTGTLLAIDAPLAGSATGVNGDWYAQWQPVAAERKLEKLWSAGTVDLEQAYAVTPDLIVVSTGGADSAKAQLADFRQIAPTIVVDYGGQTWQELATLLGEASGLEKEASARISEFDSLVQQAREKITVPPGQANIISYNGPGIPNPIATARGVHSSLLASLGFKMEDPNPAWQTTVKAQNDFVWATYENLTQLTAATTFLLRAPQERVDAFLRDPMLANLPSVQTKRVYSLGINSFRIDYYSASEIVRDVVKNFAKTPAASGQ